MTPPEDAWRASMPATIGGGNFHTHLPAPARYALDAAQVIGAGFMDLDNGGGYLFRVWKNGRGILCGGGGVCSYPVNGAIPVSIARDKSHTKSVMRDARLPHIGGGLFFAHQRRISMRGPGREIADAIRFADTIGYPIFCKPNTGGRGNFAEIIPDRASLEDYMRRVVVEFETFLIEPVVLGTEHRIVVKDGIPLYHVTKSPPALFGDGIATTRELLDRYNASLAGTGVSPLPPNILAVAGFPPDYVPSNVQRIPLPGRQNLHAFGGAEQVSTYMPHHPCELARHAAAAIGLRMAAVDMFDVSPARDLSQLVIIEVNGNPGLEVLERSGRWDIIRHIWTQMLLEFLGP